MKKIEQVYREILFRALERGQSVFTQKDLATGLNISLSTVNHALVPLKNMGAVNVRAMGFGLASAKKLLYYWASIRNLKRDIIYSTRAELGVREIERGMPAKTFFTAYSGYKLKFRKVPADYSEVYAYAADSAELEKRFPASGKKPNLFVLQADGNMEKYGKTVTDANLFVDLWNLGEWYAKDFLDAMGGKIHGLLE